MALAEVSMDCLLMSPLRSGDPIELFNSDCLIELWTGRASGTPLATVCQAG